MAVFVNNLQDKIDIDRHIEDEVIKIAEKVMHREGFGHAELSIVFVDDSYIQELNFKYRNIDAPTDVLSFYFEDEDNNWEEQDEMEYLLGDVVISMETACRQAKVYGHSFKREILYLTVHGILHLCGYDHDTEEKRKIMRGIEEEVLSNI